MQREPETPLQRAERLLQELKCHREIVERVSPTLIKRMEERVERLRQEGRNEEG